MQYTRGKTKHMQIKVTSGNNNNVRSTMMEWQILTIEPENIYNSNVFEINPIERNF